MEIATAISYIIMEGGRENENSISCVWWNSCE